VAGWSKSVSKLLKFLQGVLLMYWVNIPKNKLVIAKKRHLNPFYCSVVGYPQSFGTFGKAQQKTDRQQTHRQLKMFLNTRTKRRL
jgi:hypothetical protein